jgi:hypothetical protein
MLKRAEGETGAVAILIALLLVVLLGVAALVVDLGMLYHSKRQLQTAADAAAIAAAYDLPDATTAENRAFQYAGLNAVQVAETDPTTPYDGNPDKIEVVCSRSVGLFFAPIWGVHDSQVSARAVAARTIEGLGYAIFSEDPNYDLVINGPNRVIGSAFCNANIIFTGENMTVSGDVEAGKTIDIRSQNYEIEGSEITGVPYQSVVDYARSIGLLDLIDREMAAASPPTPGNVEIKNPTGGVYNGPIYATGNVTIKEQVTTVNGSIIAGGDIWIETNSMVTLNCPVIYSINGNIRITKAAYINGGSLYAPNGRISLQAPDIRVDGRLLGWQVLLNSSNLTCDVTKVSSRKVVVRLVE